MPLEKIRSLVEKNGFPNVKYFIAASDKEKTFWVVLNANWVLAQVDLTSRGGDGVSTSLFDLKLL